MVYRPSLAQTLSAMSGGLHNLLLEGPVQQVHRFQIGFKPPCGPLMPYKAPHLRLHI